jgi:hypothetical protein
LIFLRAEFAKDPHPNVSAYLQQKRGLEEFGKNKVFDLFIVEITNITLAGVPATKFIVTCTDKTSLSSDFYMKIMYIVVKREGIIYELSHCAGSFKSKKYSAEKFEEYLPLANEFIDSFLFL